MLRILFTTAAMAFTCSSIMADDDVHELVQDNSAFACDLYSQLSSKDGNLFFSPYSISTALAMTQSGARGETAAQMAQVLHFSIPQDRLPSAFAQLRSDLIVAQGVDNVTLTTANSIWPSDRYKVLDDYIGLLRSNYDVALTPLDYSQTEVARHTINKWVENKTQNKITNLIGPGVLTLDTKLTLVNAIYFHGKWQSPFQPKDTSSWPFEVSLDHVKDVQMMWGKEKFPYAALSTLQILELPYQGGGISMLIMLPDSTDGLRQVETKLSPKILSEWKSKLEQTEIVVRLPKFKMTWGTESLNVPLKALGMTDAFDGRANFAGIDGNPLGLYIGDVLHKAFIDVKEEGTEAAAATAVVMPKGAAPAPGPVFLANHPFLFLIQENKTGSILFIGRVIDPTVSGG
jgi:serpin B